ncbi:MAG TPA: YciI family protein [Gemmatimonadaceae bacterium]|nr:YciI family protein [Gemmatimonadaceae bacterium]
MADFIYIYRNSASARNATMGTPEGRQKSMESWMTWLRGLDEKGHLRSAGQPLQPAGKLVNGGTRAIVDGPFAEAKDVIGGYSIVIADSAEEAAELAKGCPGLDDPQGSVEVRPIAAM